MLLRLNKATEVYHYCSLSCYVFHTERFMQPFLHVSVQIGLCVVTSETKETHRAFSVNQANKCLFCLLTISSHLVWLWYFGSVTLMNAYLVQFSHAGFFLYFKCVSPRAKSCFTVHAVILYRRWNHTLLISYFNKRSQPSARWTAG